MADYRRMVAGRGEDAMAPLDGESCGGCYQIISPSLLDKLRLGQPVICTSCSRLLYVSDSQTVGR
jgi:predicted  nucleic acid-binding Zn-ribbon protein